MRISAIVFGLVLACDGPVYAQKAAAIGVKAGANFATTEFKGEGVTADTDRRTGWVGGLFVVWPADSALALQTEALFSQKGTRFNEDGVEAELDIDYLELPVLARASTAASRAAAFHVFAGPALGVRLSARAKATFEGEEHRDDGTDEVKRLDVGLVVGAGVELGRFTVDVRYTWGLSDLTKDPIEDFTTKNRVFALMGGIRF